MKRYLPLFCIVLASALLVCVDGCVERGGPDVGTDVFRTTTQSATRRRAKAIEDWQNTAIKLLALERSDLTAKRGEDAKIEVSGDGYTQAIDLSPLEDQLIKRDAVPRIIIRQYLMKQLPVFDQERLKAAGFDKLKGRIRPMLVSRQELAELGAKLGGSAQLHSTGVIGDLAWTPAEYPVKSDAESAEDGRPISAEALAAWKVKPADVDQTALANLQPELKQDAIVTTFLGPGLRAGTIKPGTNCAIIILPGFFSMAQQAWDTPDELAVLVANRRDVRFIERRNEKLLGLMWPGWRKALAQNNPPLSSTPLLLTGEGFAALNYTPPSSRPATAPATAPATRVYIVH